MLTEPIGFVAPTASADGYGTSAEYLGLAAVRAGADVELIEYDWRDTRFADSEWLARRVPEGAEQRVRVVYFLPYALARFQAPVLISMTMFETDRMPPKWAALVNHFATGMIVPTEFGRDVFQQAVDVPVKVVPFGTDATLYRYLGRGLERRPWVFLMAGSLHYRKGVEFALQAFREEFSDGEDVRLWLKTRMHHLDAGPETETLTDSRVSVIDFDYSREEMVNLYHSADVFLAPSRGEGSGLTPRDAMSTGLPVIATDWSGLSEICDERYGYPIPIDCLERAPVDCSSYSAGVTGGGCIGNFARPSVAAIREAMRESYEDRADARERGRKAAWWMRTDWTWGRCAQKWLDAIEELSGQ